MLFTCTHESLSARSVFLLQVKHALEFASKSRNVINAPITRDTAIEVPGAKPKEPRHRIDSGRARTLFAPPLRVGSTASTLASAEAAFVSAVVAAAAPPAPRAFGSSSSTVRVAKSVPNGKYRAAPPALVQKGVDPEMVSQMKENLVRQSETEARIARLEEQLIAFQQQAATAPERGPSPLPVETMTPTSKLEVARAKIKAGLA